MTSRGTARQITRAQARRIAVRAQDLTAERPTLLAPLVDQLMEVRYDQTAHVVPSAHLVAWSRLGARYQREELTRALETDRELFEWAHAIITIELLPVKLAAAQAFPPWDESREWLEVNEGFQADVLDRLRAEGPLLAKQIPDTSQVSWSSSGWSNDRNVIKMIELLHAQGKVAVSRRAGRQRVWDLAERVYPSDLPEIPLEAAGHLLAEHRLSSLGIAPASRRNALFEASVGDAGEGVTVEGSDRVWRVDPSALALVDEPNAPRTALLSPLDGLVFHRERLTEIFEFDYLLEMYKPAAARRWGYWALPILHGDRLIGKLDAQTDLKAKTLTINAIHEDHPFNREVREAVEAEIDALAVWLGVERVDALASP